MNAFLSHDRYIINILVAMINGKQYLTPTYLINNIGIIVDSKDIIQIYIKILFFLSIILISHNSNDNIYIAKYIIEITTII